MVDKVQNKALKCPFGHEYYKGEVLGNLPHGFGKLFNCCNKIPIKISSKTHKYEGYFRDGLFEGIGTLICKDDVKFEGSFSKGQRHG